MLTPTDSHTATLLPDGQVLVAGGSTSGCVYGGTSGAELYNPATGTWAATGSMTTARADQTATLLGNGKVLVTGGMGIAIPSSLSSAELYNPATGTWAATGSMTTAREGQVAVLRRQVARQRPDWADRAVPRPWRGCCPGGFGCTGS